MTCVGGCRLIFGSISIQDMSKLLVSGPDGETIDIHIASLEGATIAIGLPDDLDALRSSDDLPIGLDRTADRDAARAAGLPASFCEWLYRGDRGTSSDYIAHRVTGIPANTDQAVPRDNGDFKRCLDVIDALRGHVAEPDVLILMGENSEQWHNLAGNWLTLQDMSGKSGLQCCDLIQNLIKQGNDYG